MTNREMVTKYLASVGMKLVKDGGTIEPLLPFLMTDVAYNMWITDIQPIECRHHIKKLKNAWISRCRLFFSRFFSAFTPDEQCEVTDKMDSFDAYIENHVMVTKVQIMNYLKGLDTKEAMICASLLIINIMCQSAQIVWQHVYKNSRDRDRTNPDIEALEKLSCKFMDAYHSSISSEHVDTNKSDQIVKAVDILCHKMTMWLKIDKQDSAAETQELTIQCKK